jgi:hypothetical protein
MKKIPYNEPEMYFFWQVLGQQLFVYISFPYINLG